MRRAHLGTMVMFAGRGPENESIPVTAAVASVASCSRTQCFRAQLCSTQDFSFQVECRIQATGKLTLHRCPGSRLPAADSPRRAFAFTSELSLPNDPGRMAHGPATLNDHRLWRRLCKLHGTPSDRRAICIATVVWQEPPAEDRSASKCLEVGIYSANDRHRPHCEE